MPSPAGIHAPDVGAVPPPPGVTPNFDNPDYRSGGIVPLACIFIPWAAIFMALRVYTKVRIIKVFGLEDWTIIVAYLCTLFLSIDCLVQQKYGNGIHEWDITIAKLVPYSKWAAASVVVFVPAVGLAKVAILLFYLRVNPDRGFRTAVYVSLVLTTSYVVALSLAIFFQCDPVAKFWNPFLSGNCLDSTRLYLANAVLNVIFDFVVLLVPVPMLRKLQVSTRQKWVIGALFSLGSVTCVISIVRIYFQHTVLGEPDLSWHIPTPTSLVFVECNLSIICGSAMVLRPFLRRHCPRLLGGDYRRYKSPPGLQAAYDGPQGPGSKSEYRTKVSARHGRGSGMVKSWHGWRNKTTSGSDGTAVEDVAMGSWGKVPDRDGWGRQLSKGQRSESEENIIQPVEAAVVVGKETAPGILKTIDVDVRSGGG
ncbi:MAG: hypothetical protein Q9196_004142 [Gyalolechia fulgens]